MRSLLLALLAGALLVPVASAADLRHFDDAALHAVQFVSADEGWAVGDDGVVLQTIDGGQTWERQPTGVRASLRGVHFMNPFTGWAVGREELPLGAGSSGVLLYTQDGGLKWHRVTLNAMPGLYAVRFTSDKVGYVVGDGTDQYPSGVFVTRDAGRTWQPLPGPHCPGWLAAEFRGDDGGALVGAWNRMATVRGGRVVQANVDTLGGRNLRGLYLGRATGQRGVAVGQGGLILLTDNAGSKWSYPELRFSPEVLSSWDFHAVHGAGTHVWAAGRPGSVLLHSGDGGRTWEVQKSGQPLPLNGLFFHDEKRGWAVGELGTILATADGGKTWTAQRRGGQRSAVLLLHARASAVPADVVSLLGGDEGYLTTAIRLVTPDHASAPYTRAAEGARLSAAVRLAGGAAGEMLWQFPLPAHLSGRPRDEVLKAWDSLQGDASAEQLLRQFVLALRVWRPDVVITDNPDVKTAVSSLDTLAGEVAREAFRQAADPQKFPEQMAQLGLQPWKAAKLYSPCDEPTPLALDLTAVRASLEATVRDFAAPAAGLLAGQSVIVPRQRHFRLLASHIAGAESHKSLTEGIPPAPTGEARRKQDAVAEMSPDLKRALRTRASLQAMAELPAKELNNPDRMMALMGPMLKDLPEGQAAPAAHAIASNYARLGQWHLAREAFLMMVDRFPTHPLTADAYRWLIRHNSSSETRRRHELGQFLVTQEFSLQSAAKEGTAPITVKKKEDVAQAVRQVVDNTRVDVHLKKQLALTRSGVETRRWHEGSLELEPRLEGFGPVLANDPAVQFCLHAARRNLGDFETAKQWFTRFMAGQPAGPWRDAAAAELWLTERRGAPPKPVLVCTHAETRPFLDGKFDDPCWSGVAPFELKDASGNTLKDAPTKVWLAYDQDFLYLALRCEHPEGKPVPLVKPRSRDADLKDFDRVSLVLDLDRDYATAYHFQIDQRGCVREDCWGDASWDPRWFVAVHSEPTAWQIEAAIPIAVLTGDTITTGRAWACNVVRLLPGRGVQGWSLPAEEPVGVQPRLEGMGLLMFKADPRKSTATTADPRMPRAP